MKKDMRNKNGEVKSVFLDDFDQKLKEGWVFADDIKPVPDSPTISFHTAYEPDEPLHLPKKRGPKPKG